MLEVLIDPYKIETKADYIIEDYKNFASQWESIIKWVRDDDKKTISLLDKPLEKYFDHLKDIFGKNIQLTPVLPRQKWEAVFQLQLNEDISDSEIANLLKLQYLPKNKETYLTETLLLISGNYTNEGLSLEEDLLEVILKNIEKRYPLTFPQAMNEFISIQPAGKRELWQFIADSDSKKLTVQKIIMTALVKNYPPGSTVYKKYYLPSFDYKAVEFYISSLDFLPIEFKETIKDYLSTFNDLAISDFISGWLKEEFDVVLRLLNNKPLQAEAIITKLLKKAQYLPDIKNELIKFYPVASPPFINFQADESTINWLEDYFKYYKYTRLIGQPTLTQEFTTCFGEFLFNSFSQNTEWLINNSILSIKVIIDSYLKDKRSLLLLVVDGLGYEYAETLRDTFKTDIRMLFSTPPTTTKQNKQRILSGLVDTRVDYTEIISEVYKDVKVKESNSRIDSLVELLKNEADLYIFWENQFDTLIHTEMTYKKRFADHLAILRRIKDEIEKFLEDGGVVILTGDHGFTVLPCDDNNCVSLPDHILESHRRIAFCKDSEIPTFREKYYSYEDMLIAKSYFYFNSLPKGGTHGGLTPEEAVVPLLIIEKRPLKVIPIEFQLSEKSYYRKQIIATKLSIYNPNPFNVTIDDIFITPNILYILDSKLFLPAKKETGLNVELNLKEIEQEKVVMTIKYTINNVSLISHLELMTKGAMIERDLDWD